MIWHLASEGKCSKMTMIETIRDFVFLASACISQEEYRNTTYLEKWRENKWFWMSYSTSQGFSETSVFCIGGDICIMDNRVWIAFEEYVTEVIDDYTEWKGNPYVSSPFMHPIHHFPLRCTG